MTQFGQCCSCNNVAGFYCQIDKKWYCGDHQMFSSTIINKNSESVLGDAGELVIKDKDGNIVAVSTRKDVPIPKKSRSPFGRNYYSRKK